MADRTYRRRASLLGAALSAVLVPAAALAGETNAAADYDAVRDLLWEKEQAIYAGRGRGDVGPYIESTSQHYVSWPPTVALPFSYDDLAAVAGKPVQPSREKLEMVYRHMSLSGDTAVIYYATHMTVSADGTPVDRRYHVTHTWVRENGTWRVLGGMARQVEK